MDRDTREDYPRVSVGSVQDWQRLKINYRNAMVASLEEQIHAGALEGERDALVARANEFVDQTFRIAQPNLRINGQNFETLNQHEQNMEPFDEALDRRIWSLAATRLQWQKRIAETRRRLPLEMETTVLELLEEQRAVEMEEVVLVSEEVVGEEEEDEQLPRYPQISESLQAALGLGEELDQTIPTQEERGERIKHVAADIKMLGS